MSRHAHSERKTEGNFHRICTASWVLASDEACLTPTTNATTGVFKFNQRCYDTSTHDL